MWELATKWEGIPVEGFYIEKNVFDKGMRRELENKLDNRPHHKGFYKWIKGIIDYVNGNPNTFILVISFLAFGIYYREINFV